MLRSSLTLDEAIQVLNELVACDARAMGELILTRVNCNAAMAHHRTVKVTSNGTVGLLGVLNALFSTLGAEAGKREGWGGLAATFDDDGRLLRFERTDGLPRPED